MNSPLKCLVFDCDGVILDSVPVKTRAFARLAEPYGPEARDRFVIFHNLHGGVSRYKKFEWFFKEILGREISAQESAAWGERFADYALDEVRHCALIPGAQATLDAWHGLMPLYVCSGAPDEELKLILRERGLAGYFAAIYGSPPGKAQRLRQIVAEAGFEPQEALMIGDARTDLDAAESVGTQFYGVGSELRDGTFPWSEDLTPLNAWIAARCQRSPKDAPEKP